METAYDTGDWIEMMKYSSSTVSIRNRKDQQKPNEDYYLADDEKGIYILVDGVSRDKSGGIYPNPSPARIVSELFVNCVYQVLAEDKGPSVSAALREAVEKGNEVIQDYNAQTSWENDFLPGTVGIAAVVRNEKLYYAYIGDCFGMILNRGLNLNVWDYSALPFQLAGQVSLLFSFYWFLLSFASLFILHRIKGLFRRKTL